MRPPVTREPGDPENNGPLWLFPLYCPVQGLTAANAELLHENEIPEGYYRITHVARMLNIRIENLRHWAKKPGVRKITRHRMVWVNYDDIEEMTQGARRLGA